MRTKLRGFTRVSRAVLTLCHLGITFNCMQTVSFKMERRQVQLLRDRARLRGCSQATVIRELIEKHLGNNGHPSLHDQAKDFCGCFSGPKDLSTRKLKGYGRD